MKKLVKFSALSLFIFAFACFPLISCGNGNNANNATGDVLAGSRYKYSFNEGGVSCSNILEFKADKKFSFNIETFNSGYVAYRGDYKIEGNKVTCIATWAIQGNATDLSLILTIEDGGKMLVQSGGEVRFYKI